MWFRLQRPGLGGGDESLGGWCPRSGVDYYLEVFHKGLSSTALLGQGSQTPEGPWVPLTRDQQALLAQGGRGHSADGRSAPCAGNSGCHGSPRGASHSVCITLGLKGRVLAQVGRALSHGQSQVSSWPGVSHTGTLCGRPVTALVFSKNLSQSDFPGCSDGKESACNAGDMGSVPGSGRSPGEGQPTPVFLPGESHGQRSLAGYSP